MKSMRIGVHGELFYLLLYERRYKVLLQHCAYLTLCNARLVFIIVLLLG